MDEAIALLFLAPALLLGLWLVDFTGGSSLADGRAQLAAYEAAAAAAEKMDRAGMTPDRLNDAARDARDTALTAMLDACRDLRRDLVTVAFADGSGGEWTGDTWPQAPAGTVLQEVRVEAECRTAPSPLFDGRRTALAVAAIPLPESPASVPTGKRALERSGG